MTRLCSDHPSPCRSWGGLSARRNAAFRRGASCSCEYAADDSLTKSWRADGSAASYFEYDKTGSCVKIHSGDGTTYFEYQERPGPTGTGANMVSRLAKLGGSAWEFAYDGNLRRYAIVEDGTPTYFLWDGLRLLETYSPAHRERRGAREAAAGRTQERDSRPAGHHDGALVR